MGDELYEWMRASSSPNSSPLMQKKENDNHDKDESYNNVMYVYR